MPPKPHVPPSFEQHETLRNELETLVAFVTDQLPNSFVNITVLDEPRKCGCCFKTKGGIGVNTALAESRNHDFSRVMSSLFVGNIRSLLEFAMIDHSLVESVEMLRRATQAAINDAILDSHPDV